MRDSKIGKKNCSNYRRGMETNEYCILCFKDMNDKQKRTYTTNGCKCKPHMHETCFTKWIQQHPGTCPICRKKVIMIHQSSNQVDIVKQGESCSGWIACCCAVLFYSVVN